MLDSLLYIGATVTTAGLGAATYAYYQGISLIELPSHAMMKLEELFAPRKLARLEELALINAHNQQQAEELIKMQLNYFARTQQSHLDEHSNQAKLLTLMLDRQRNTDEALKLLGETCAGLKADVTALKHA